MFRRTLFAPLALALVLFSAACEDEGTGSDEERFTATLNGQNERPNAVTTNATGTATFTVNDDGTVDFKVDVNNITGVTGAHIHGPAGVNENAGVLVPLPVTAGTGTVNGTLAQGSFTSAQINPNANLTLDALLQLMRTGQTYVNVHTSVNKPGEIRGQIQPR
jgi:Cu/Zn superoxide dismutase